MFNFTTKKITYSFVNHDFSLFKDGTELLIWISIMAIVNPLLKRYLLHPLSLCLIPPETKGRKENLLIIKRQKIIVAFRNLFFHLTHLSLAAWTVLTIKDSSFLFNPSILLVPYLKGEIPYQLRRLYMVEMAHYSYTLFAMFADPLMKDRLQMTTHHLFTLLLQFSSYYFNTMKIGTAIMILHDLSDPLMEIAKIFNYLNCQLGADIFFVLFASSFIYLRDYLYPSTIIKEVYENALSKYNYPFYHVTLSCLIGLWILHIIWTFMIIKIVLNLVFKGKRGDLREEDA